MLGGNRVPSASAAGCWGTSTHQRLGRAGRGMNQRFPLKKCGFSFFFFFLACAQPAGLRWLRGAPGRPFFHPEGFEPGGCSTCPLPARGDAPGGLEMIGGGRQQAGTGVISSPKPLQGSFGFLPPVNRLNGKRAWLGATETLLLHVISLITS